MSENGVKCSTTISQNLLFFGVVAVETIFLVPSAVFTFLNAFASDESHYKTYHPDLSGIVGFHFLLPIFIYQNVWLLVNVASVIALHNTVPYLFLAANLIPIIGLGGCIWILVPSVNHVIMQSYEVPSFFLAFTITLFVFVILMLIFCFPRYSTLRKLMKKKKAVQTTTEKLPEDTEAPAPVEVPVVRIKDPDEISTTFSRRSTMSMSEERYVPPPRM